MTIHTILAVSGLLAAGTGTFATTLSGAILDVQGTGCTASGDGYAAVVLSKDWFSFGDPWLLKVDNEGRLLGTEILGADLGASREMESGGLIEEFPDGSAIVAFYSEPRATGRNADACVMKLDPDGVLTWETVLGLEDDEVYRITGLAACGDGSFVVSGSKGCGEETPFAAIFDPEGGPAVELEVEKGLSIEDVCIASDGRILLFATGDPDSRLIFLGFARSGIPFGRTTSRLDDLLPADFSIEEAVACSDGSICICGSGYPGPWICRLSGDGDPVWFQSWKGEGIISSVAELSGNRTACCGCTAGSGGSRMSAVLAVYDSSGVMLWQRLYEDGEFTSFSHVRVMEDGGFLLAGSMDMSGVDDIRSEALLVRTDRRGVVDSISTPEGTSEIHPLFQSLDSPPHGWIIACGVYTTPEEARISASHAADATHLEPGVLWIPDWPSLSGFEGWLAYLVPEAVDGSGWTDLCTSLKVGWPDAYLVWIGLEEESRSRALIPGN
ncbi:hypothetical protein GX411_01780 [Candidatus Fermentibacteria bacterium]|nr:hypothetical protein [Candidatus Fermentibacteria bacterium]